MKTKIALIPAYKPDIKLITLIESLIKTDIIPVVVNDGSGNEFDGIFQKANEYCHVLSHQVNKGKGRALKTGLSYIKDTYKKDYIVVTLDADGQHTIKDAKKVLSLCEENPKVLVLGSRFFDKHTPLRSRFGNTLTRLVYKISTGISVYDTQTGLRAFSDEIIDNLIDIKGERYEYEMNVLLECKNSGIKIIETKIETIYIDNNSSSHFDAVKDSIRIYKNILKFSASSIFSFLVDYGFYSLFLVIFGLFGISKTVTFSNICARCISSVVNFNINRKYVFKSKKNIIKSLIEYYFLVAVILIGNTLVLNFFIYKLSLNAFFAKIVTEIVFFIISFFTQNFIVFKRES